MEGFEFKPKELTPEEKAKIMTSRLESDAELNKPDADSGKKSEYKVSEKGNIYFDVAEESIERARDEMGREKGASRMTRGLMLKESRGTITPEEKAELDSWREFEDRNEYNQRELVKKEKLGALGEFDKKALEIYRKAKSENRPITNDEAEEILNLGIKKRADDIYLGIN